MMTPSRHADRVATSRRFLMCRPEFFEVSYSINPWMDTASAVDAELATLQWESLRSTYQELGHGVELIDPAPGLPDMVFAANGATVVGDKVYAASFRHAQRFPEGALYKSWFERRGYEVHDAGHVNEGQGDFLLAGGMLLAGTGFRTVCEAHVEAQEFFGIPTVTLQLTDPRFYHLDTALTVLSMNNIAYYPGAFSPGSLAILRRLFPDAVLATDDDAEVLGLNAMSDGRHVVLPAAATELALELKKCGYEPIPLELSELRKAGGGIKCCTLELSSWQ